MKNDILYECGLTLICKLVFLFFICLNQFPEEPKPSANCPRQNGYFGHKDKNVCDKFYYCVDGQFNMITCPSGLVFNQKTGICTWPDEAHKIGCSSEGNIIKTKIFIITFSMKFRFA